MPSEMLRDDDLIDDDFQGNAYGPFLETKTRSHAFVPGRAFYGFLALLLVGALAASALAQTSFAGIVSTVAGFVCFATLLAVVTLSERRIGRFVRTLVVTIGASAYVAIVAGIASIHRR